MTDQSHGDKSSPECSLTVFPRGPAATCELRHVPAGAWYGADNAWTASTSVVTCSGDVYWLMPWPRVNTWPLRGGAASSWKRRSVAPPRNGHVFNLGHGISQY